MKRAINRIDAGMCSSASRKSNGQRQRGNEAPAPSSEVSGFVISSRVFTARGFSLRCAES